MAYNRGGYNPDALPAHAEPDQAAQMMNPPPRQSSSSSSYNKPQPPPPQQGGYGRPPPNQGYGQGGYPPQQQQGGYQSQGGYNDYNQGQRYGQSQPQQGYNQGAPPPRRDAYGSPPPPASYGQGGPPPPNFHNRPPLPDQQRPPTTAPPRDANDRDSLWPLFLQVDKGRTGQLSEEELRRALVNGDYTAFDPHTVKMMIRMFDTDRSGTINFDEFCGLWGFLAAWRGLFDRFDVDKSGSISLREFEDALVAFGYRLSPQFVQLLFGTYARTHSRGRGDDGERERVLSFDLFVQACISLKRMTDVFKKYDTDRDGYITLSFEEFLTGAQGLFLFNSISPATDTGLY
ncbi:hypothetical protein BDY17DRAFT_298221 [Neohortaea acidophila]|uniref:EF-hand domain-containing protein n=1 Tax=Neohortaea acidophila TaxID=245834 RepID=A0A6A6PRG3_9PEZI|nr:uncharacterized protein BDY17DRAFT_298221 [Neohortaea acidophila]KAF2482261.1 hypothetical protein BDY17DRAFT_298221 [Neohortaea acidophila]